MQLRALIADSRTSLESTAELDVARYRRWLGHLQRYAFWERREGRPGLWSHQQCAIALAAAYLSAKDRGLKAEGIANEAALIKMATGTGKSAVICVLARCLPDIRRVLILTPREELTRQLHSYLRSTFWTTMNLRGASEVECFCDPTGAAAGAPVELVEPQILLPSKAAILAPVPAGERVVLVGTLQALDQIRRASIDRREGAHEAAELLDLVQGLDLVIIDEGHYEPAISWSRAIRNADRPTILFSATPYRNDYKSFRVRGRFVFNQPVFEALEQRIIRTPRFQELRGKTGGTLTPSELARRLVAEAKTLAVSAIEHPKVIVRAVDRDELIRLQGYIEDAGGRALVIHHAIKQNDGARRRYNTVEAARSNAANQRVRFWLHDTKLLEGVDDPSFVAIAIHDGFGNSRQLVQQIGRALRSSDPRRREKQEAVVFAPSGLLVEMEREWKAYLEFEEYCAENTAHLVTTEAAMPEHLLGALPPVQYVARRFRRRFQIEALGTDDVRIAASAVVYELDGEFDKAKLIEEIKEALLDEDRFKPVEVPGLDDDALCIVYYGWRTSPLLDRPYFPEWKLGVCALVREGNLVLVQDTEGVVFDAEQLSMTRLHHTRIAGAFPESSTKSPARVTRMATISLDVSERAIRSQATRTRSFEDTFTDLLDPAMVPTAAYGFIGGRGRYLGLRRARIRDDFGKLLPLPEYFAWARRVAKELRAKRKKNPVFARYARLAEPLAAQEAEPKNILLDFGDGFEDFTSHLDESFRDRLFDPDYTDLCSDIEHGEFEVMIGNECFRCQIALNEETGRYRIESEDLDRRFDPEQESTPVFTRYLNRNQSFRVIPNKFGVVYANGDFYEPQGFGPREDGSIAQLQNVAAVPALRDTMTEKGEKLYFSNREAWETKSQFGLFARMSKATTSRAEWATLGEEICKFDLIVCDDDGQEIGDFLALDSQQRRVAIIHAKAAKEIKTQSVSGLEVVGRQALASLAFCSTTAIAPKIEPNRWSGDVMANQTRLTGLSRLFKNSGGLAAPEARNRVVAALTNRSWSREIWIVAGRLLDRKIVEAAASKRDGSNRTWQLLMYLDTLATACARGNAKLRVFCHEGTEEKTREAKRTNTRER